MRLTEFWDAIRARVDTATLRLALGGVERVYRPTDEILPQEDSPDKPWGRLVMRPSLWPSTAEPSAPKNVAWVMSVQFNDFRAAGYDVDVPIIAAHEELFKRLDSYKVNTPRLIIYVPVYRAIEPPVSAVYDSARRLWISDAEYRCQVAP